MLHYICKRKWNDRDVLFNNFVKSNVLSFEQQGTETFFTRTFQLAQEGSQRELIRIGLEQASMCPSVYPSMCALTISNVTISKTRVAIATKFDLRHHWEACIRFCARSDQNYGFHSNR